MPLCPACALHMEYVGGSKPGKIADTQESSSDNPINKEEYIKMIDEKLLKHLKKRGGIPCTELKLYSSVGKFKVQFSGIYLNTRAILYHDGRNIYDTPHQLISDTGQNNSNGHTNLAIKLANIVFTETNGKPLYKNKEGDKPKGEDEQLNQPRRRRDINHSGRVIDPRNPQ